MRRGGAWRVPPIQTPRFLSHRPPCSLLLSLHVPHGWGAPLRPASSLGCAQPHPGLRPPEALPAHRGFSPWSHAAAAAASSQDTGPASSAPALASAPHARRGQGTAGPSPPCLCGTGKRWPLWVRTGRGTGPGAASGSLRLGHAPPCSAHPVQPSLPRCCQHAGALKQSAHRWASTGTGKSNN